MNGIYLTERLQAIGISDTDNACHGFNTFGSYHYPILKDEYYNLTNKEKERLYPSAFDNILFTYSDIWGHKIHYKSKDAKWTKTVERIRYHEANRFDCWDQVTGHVKRSPKYRTAKGGKVAAFFNGLYAYYIKPLQKQGVTKEQIIQQLQSTFRTIVITEGEFKAFAGCKNKIPTIGISGIHNAVHTIKQMITTKDQRQYEYTTDAEFLVELQEFFQLFQVKEIIFLMDQDAFDNVGNQLRSKSFFAAVRNAYYASRKTAVQLRFAYILKSTAGKGLDDILELVDPKTIRQELLTLPTDLAPKYIYQTPIQQYEQLEKIQFAFAQSVKTEPYFFASNHQYIQTKEGAKLSEAIRIEDTYNKIIVAPTGSGKTYLVATCPEWKIIVCPTISLCKNIASEYKAYQFDGKALRDFEQMMQQFKVLDIVYRFLISCYPNRVGEQSLTRNPNFITVTYKSFRKLTAYLTQYTHLFRVFIDESHNFTTSTSPSYLLKELGEVIQLSSAYQSTTLLTGTYLPAFYPSIAQLPILEVRIPKTSKPAELLACNDVLKAAETLAKKSITEGRFPMILFNSKNDSGKLGTLKSYLKDEEFAFFNANTKLDNDWQAITQNGIIAKKYKGMCVTSVLKEGNNIYNEYDFDIIIIGSFHSSEIEQFCNRPRKPKSVRIYKLISDKAQTSDSQKSIYSIATNLLYKAIATCQQLNTNEEQLAFDLLEREFTARQFIAALPIQLDEHGRCQIDELRLSNQAFQIDRIQENRNADLLRKRLAQYQIKLKPVATYKVIKSKEEMQVSKASRDKAKQEKENEFDQLYQKLQTAEIFTLASTQITHHAKQLSSVEKSVYQRIQSVTNLVTDKQQVLAMLEKSRLSNAKFTLLKRQYIVHCLHASQAYHNSQRAFSQLLQEMYKNFPIGERRTAKELKTTLLKVLNTDTSIDTSRIKTDTSNKKVLSILKLFFQLPSSKSNGSLKYAIQGTYWASIINNTTNFVPSAIKLTKNGYPDFWADIA